MKFIIAIWVIGAAPLVSAGACFADARMSHGVRCSAYGYTGSRTTWHKVVGDIELTESLARQSAMQVCEHVHGLHACRSLGCSRSSLLD